MTDDVLSKDYRQSANDWLRLPAKRGRLRQRSLSDRHRGIRSQ